MKPKQIVVGLILIIVSLLGMTFLSGCANAAQSLGFSIETQYGRFTYTLPQELPEPKGTKK